MLLLFSRIGAVAGIVLIVGCGRIGYDSRPLAEDAGAVDAFVGSATAFARLCQVDKHVIIENGDQVDDLVGRALSESAELGCRSTIARRVVSQDDPAAVDPASGRPIVPSNELVFIGGGEGPHLVVRYLLRGDTPLLWTGETPATIRLRATGRVIVEGNVDAANDYILVQVIHEPISDTLSLSGQGMRAEGTRAAALYFEQSIIPTIAVEPASWFVVKWTDTDGNGPSAGDSFELIESGS